MSDTRIVIESQETEPRGSAITVFWDRLTSPPESVVSVSLRRRMVVLASLLLIMIPVSAIGLILAHFAEDPVVPVAQDLVIRIGFAAEVTLVVAYALCRVNRFYFLSVALTLGAVAAGALATLIISPQNADAVLMVASLLSMIASLLLPLGATVFFVIVANLAVIPIAVLVPVIPLPAVIRGGTFNLVMSGLVIIASVIRRHDIHQIEEQARRVTEVMVLADETNRLKSQFLATMSHELRTPLNAIIGFAEILLMGLSGVLDEEATRSTERIHVNSERLLGLIDDLLDVSKIEAGRLEVVHEPFSPAQLLKEVERETRPLAAEKGLDLTFTLDPALPPSLVGDMQRLEQVAINLVSNGIKFTEAGSVSLVMAPRPDGKWTMTVADTGIGIPPHAQEFIFEKFRQVDGTSRRAYGGAGLGLAIARELVLLMDGGIGLRSKVGDGSTFTVTLPAVEPEKGRSLNG